jgi:hypothetical protein
VASTLTLRKGQGEYQLCWRLDDCTGDGTPTALPLQDPTTALYFLRGFINDSGQEHDLRLWLLNNNSSFEMYVVGNDEILDRTARMIASGQLVVASMEKGAGEGELEGILRPGGGGSSTLLSSVETTPLQDEMASAESAADEEAIAVEEETPAEAETTWIELELLDAEGKPVPNEQYKITFPDGVVKYGRLDSDGKARIEKLQPGSCQVTFPNRDEEVWEVG